MILHIEGSDQDQEAAQELLREHGFSVSMPGGKTPAWASYSALPAEDLLTAFLEHCIDGILIMDVETIGILYANKAFAEMLGYSIEEIRRTKIWDWEVTYSRDEIERAYATRNWAGERFETQHRRKDGQIVDVDVSHKPIFWKGKEVIFCVIKNITERKRTERVLHLTQFTVEKTGDQAFWMTPEGRFLYVNEAASTILGYSREELEGMPIWEIDPNVTRENAIHYWRHLKEMGSMRFESLHRAKDGRIYPVEVRGNYVNFEGQEYSCVFVTDISKRKQEEQALRLNQFAVDNTAEQAFWISPDGQIIYANNAACESLGYKREELVGMSLSDIDPDCSAEAVAASWNSLKKEKVRRFERFHKTRDGRIYPVEIRSNYINYDGREFRFAFATDISERKAAEEALRRSEERYRQLMEMLPIAAYTTDAKGRITFFNHKAQELWQREPKLYSDLWCGSFKLHYPDGQPMAHDSCPMAMTVKTGEACQGREIMVENPDGSFSYALAYPELLVGADGEMEGAVNLLFDITERKKAVQQLRQANLVLENSPAVLFRWKAEPGWPVEMVTRNVSRFGYTPEDLLSGSVAFADLVHPEDLDRVAAEVTEYTRREGDRFRQEYRIVTREGDVRWVDDRTVVERDVSGRVTHYQGMVIDISERKRTEEALHESDCKYRSIIENAPFGITRSNRKGELLSANPAFASILKYDSVEDLMKTVNRSSIQEVLFPEPSDREPLVENILADDAWNVFNNTLCCKNGDLVTCRIHSRRIMDESGQASTFESYHENITEHLEAELALQESEEKFRVLAETSPVAICLYQENFLTYANPAMKRLFGYSNEELRRRKYWEWVHEDDQELVRSRAQARLAGEKVPGQYEARFRSKSGEVLDVMISAGTMEYQGGLTGVASFLDITERKRTEELIRKSLEEKEVLLREIHHRVKNNLQVVSSLLYLQSQKFSDPELKTCFLESQNRVCSMALAHEQLYQSKNLSEISVKSYVESLVGQLEKAFISPGQKVQCCLALEDIPLDIEKVVPCGLLITELLSNAYKHAFADSLRGRVTVSLQSENGQIELKVADDGIGLPVEFALGQAKTLGLQLVRALVNQLGGTLEAENRNGACFQVFFPG